MITNIIANSICYVVPQVLNGVHPIAQFKNELIYYPERELTLFETLNYKQYAKSIVTENPFIISSYKKDKVRVWNKDKGWVEPRLNTYGASINKIYSGVLCIPYTIPSSVMDGGIKIEKINQELSKTYKLASKESFRLVIFAKEEY